MNTNHIKSFYIRKFFTTSASKGTNDIIFPHHPKHYKSQSKTQLKRKTSIQSIRRLQKTCLLYLKVISHFPQKNRPKLTSDILKCVSFQLKFLPLFSDYTRQQGHIPFNNNDSFWIRHASFSR